MKKLGAALWIALILGSWQSPRLRASEPEGGGTELLPASRAERLTPIIEEKLAELSTPGAIIGIWQEGETPWVAAIGLGNVTCPAPIRLNDHMRIGSITKTFVGTVVLQLVDEGKLSLEGPVARHLSDVPNGAKITVRQLGDMTSGLFNYTEDGDFLTELDRNPSKHWTPTELLALAFAHEPYFAPGKGWHYSNTNTVLLGLLIEKVTGRNYAEEINRRILRPLGMCRTSFGVTGQMPCPHAQGYMFGYNVDDDSESVRSPLRNVTGANPSWTNAAGDMISTLADLHRYARPLATGALVGEEAQKARLQWVDAPGVPKGMKYGFGIASFAGAIGHNGQIPGYQSFMGHMPKERATLIVLTNLSTTPQGAEPADQLARLIMAEIRRR